MAPINWPPRKTYNFDEDQQLGRGRNATVYECQGEDGQRLAFKFFNPNRRNIEEIRREIKILKRLRDHPNIITIIDEARPIRGPGHGIVMERVEHQDFRTLFPTLDMRDVCFYLKQLIGALAFAHSHSVMHRDIRPQNLVIDHMTKQLRVVGWGSADYYHPDVNYTSRVGLWKAPELLLDVGNYDFQVDIWAFGSMMAGMIFRLEPFFHGNSNSDQLARIADVRGSEGLYTYCLVSNIELDEEYARHVGQRDGRTLASFISMANQHLVSVEALDLIEALLQWNPGRRPTAATIMTHQYFQPLTAQEEDWTRIEVGNF